MRNNSYFKVFSQYAILFALLSQLYFSCIVTLFDYQGYENNFNVFKFFVGVFSVFLSIILVRNNDSPSYFFLHLAIGLIITPSMVLYYGGDLSNEFAFATVSSFVLMAVIAGRVKFRTLRLFAISSDRMLAVIFFISIVYICSIFLFGGGRYINFDISLVYEYRSAASSNLPSIYEFLTPIFGKVIIPFGLVFSLDKRKYFFTAVLSICSILIFALTANKAPLFFPFIIYFVYVISEKRNIVSIFLFSVNILIFFCLVDFWMKDVSSNQIFGWFGSIVGRRGLLVPSELNFKYIDFFLENKFYYWSESKVTMGIFDNPYNLSPSNLIGKEFFDSEETAANTGWIGSGFANAGYFGVYMYAILIGFVFSFLDSYAKKVGKKIVIALFVLPAMVMLTSTDFLTMLLTHGLLVSILMIASIRPEKANGIR